MYFLFCPTSNSFAQSNKIVCIVIITGRTPILPNRNQFKCYPNRNESHRIASHRTQSNTIQNHYEVRINKRTKTYFLWKRQQKKHSKSENLFLLSLFVHIKFFRVLETRNILSHMLHKPSKSFNSAGNFLTPPNRNILDIIHLK